MRKPKTLSHNLHGTQSAASAVDETSARRFFTFEGQAGTLKSGQWLLRARDKEWYSRYWRQWSKPKRWTRAMWARPRPIFEYERVWGKPDINWGSRDLSIVSGRLRAFIERWAPAAAKFHAVEIVGPGRETHYPEYWAVNWLRGWRCQRDTDMPEIDSKLIPPKESLGVVVAPGGWWDGHVVCDLRVKRAAEAERFLGLRFSEVRQVRSAKESFRWRNPLTRKYEPMQRQCLPYDPLFEVDAFIARFPERSYPPRYKGSSAILEYATMHSARDGVDARTLKKLLELGEDPNAGHDQSGMPFSPIPVFVQPKSPSVLRTLGQYGADWNIRNSLGITPFISAAISHDTAAMRLLKTLGADPQARDVFGRTALHHVLDSCPLDTEEANSMVSVSKFLLGAGLSLNDRDQQGDRPGELLRKSPRSRDGEAARIAMPVVAFMRSNEG